MKDALQWFLIAVVIWAMALFLHTINAESATNCRLVTVAYPEMQISMVSKECWETPDQVIEVTAEPVLVIPRAKPLPQVDKPVQPKRKAGKCGSKRMVWRTLKSGRKKYRCRK